MNGYITRLAIVFLALNFGLVIDIATDKIVERQLAEKHAQQNHIPDAGKMVAAEPKDWLTQLAEAKQ